MGTRSKGKRRQVRDRWNDLKKAKADTAYQQAVHEYEVALARAEFEAVPRLCDPQHNISLGLPAELPLPAIAVLSQMMALDKVGPTRPWRDTFYKRYGVKFSTGTLASHDVTIAPDGAEVATLRFEGVDPDGMEGH